MNIYVGNLASDVTESELMTEFEAFGKVSRTKIIKDMYTGQAKGFGFVEMPGTAEAMEAIKQLNTKELKGKKLIVNEAKPKSDDNRGGGRSGGSGFGGGRKGGSSQRGSSGGFSGSRKRF